MCVCDVTGCVCVCDVTGCVCDVTGLGVCDVTGEATRLMAWIIKNSKAAQVMRNLVRAEGLQHLVTMATSEHLVMQNEALLALNLIASTVLGKDWGGGGGGGG